MRAVSPVFVAKTMVPRVSRAENHWADRLHKAQSPSIKTMIGDASMLPE